MPAKGIENETLGEGFWRGNRGLISWAGAVFGLYPGGERGDG